MPTKQAETNEGPPACRSAHDLTRLVPLSDDADALARDAGSTAELLGRLRDQDLEVDSMRVLAYTLPIRQAVWWSILCAWHALDGSPREEQHLALGAAVRWVLEPTREQCRQAEAVSQSRLLEDAGDCCVRAASLAGHAPAPARPFVAADVAGAARMVLAAVFLAYAQRAEAEPDVSYHRFATLGRLVGAGRIPWAEPNPSSHRET